MNFGSVLEFLIYRDVQSSVRYEPTVKHVAVMLEVHNAFREDSWEVMVHLVVLVGSLPSDPMKWVLVWQ
jgi:hypothetical protein